MDGTKLTNEMEALKNKLRTTWMAGDFGRIANSYRRGAAEFVDRLGLRPGMRVLDAACGTGNLSLPAARTGASVTGLDIAPNLIEQARANAAAEGLDIRFDVGDVEAMPYEDGSFDVVFTMFGAMFAPRADVTAAELKRVCRPGGVIAMANWTPDAFIGQMFKATGKYVPPPAGMDSPLLWGDKEAVAKRFSSGIAGLTLTVQPIELTFPFGPDDTVEHFRMFYGPSQKAFEALEDVDRREQLRRDLEDLWTANNTAEDGTTRVVPEYLEVRAVRA
jgi:SAM-dependent methyltransferase